MILNEAWWYHLPPRHIPSMNVGLSSSESWGVPRPLQQQTLVIRRHWDHQVGWDLQRTKRKAAKRTFFTALEGNDRCQGHLTQPGKQYLICSEYDKSPSWKCATNFCDRSRDSKRNCGLFKTCSGHEHRQMVQVYIERGSGTSEEIGWSGKRCRSTKYIHETVKNLGVQIKVLQILLLHRLLTKVRPYFCLNYCWFSF